MAIETGIYIAFWITKSSIAEQCLHISFYLPPNIMLLGMTVSIEVIKLTVREEEMFIHRLIISI